MITTGIRIRELRKENELTLEQVGIKLGTTKVTISRYGSDVRIPGGEYMMELAKLYNVSTDYLYCLTDDRRSSNNEKYVVKVDYTENLKNFIMKEVELYIDNESFTEADMELFLLVLKLE